MIADVYLTSACESLGKSLTQLSQKVAVIEDTDLNSLVKACVGFHKIVTSEVDGLITQYEKRTSHLEDLVASLEASDDFYVSAFLKGAEMKKEGALISAVYEYAMQNQLNQIEAIRLIRYLFKVSLEEAVLVIA